MRKQDRLAREQQIRAQEPSDKQSQAQPMKQREEIRGSGERDQPPTSSERSGKLPLPD